MPTSIQYPVPATAHRVPAAAISGNVSRSIDTGRPASMRSSTEGSRTYTPALTHPAPAGPGRSDAAGASAAAGFSVKDRTRPRSSAATSP